MRSIYITVILVLIASFSAFGQVGKFEFGISLFSNYSMGFITNDGTFPIDFEADIRENETWKFSYSAQIFAEYSITERSAFVLGIGYQNTGRNTKLMSLISSDPGIPSGIRLINSHHYIEFPISYKLILRESFYIQPGISPLLNLSNTITIIQLFSDDRKPTSDTVEITDTEFNKLLFAGQLAIGIDVYENEKVAVFVHPMVQYTFTGVAKDIPLNRNHLGAGITTGLRI